MLARSYSHSDSDQQTLEQVRFVITRRAACSELFAKATGRKYGLPRCGMTIREEEGVGDCGDFGRSNFGYEGQREGRSRLEDLLDPGCR
jgi:hypothetical protein